MAMNSSRGRTFDARTNQLDHMLYVLKLVWRVRVKYVSLPVKLHVVLSIAWIKPISLAGRQSRGSKISVSSATSPSQPEIVIVIQPTNFLRHFQESGIPPATDIPRAPAAKSPSQLEQLTAPASAVSFSAESPSQPEKTSKPCGSAASDAVAEGAAAPASSSETGGQGTTQFPMSSTSSRAAGTGVPGGEWMNSTKHFAHIELLFWAAGLPPPPVLPK